MQFRDEEFELFDNIFFNTQQKEIEDRIRQEKLDAEFALSLQNGNPVPAPAARIPAAPSAFDRLSGMRPPKNAMQNGRTSSIRTLPWAANNSASIIKPEPQSLSPYAMEPGSYNSTSNNMNGFKTKASSSRMMPGAFPDDSSTASDSDIEIIGPEAFHDNGRHVPTLSGSRTSLSGSVYGAPQPRMLPPSFSPEAQTPGDAALRRVEQASTNNALQTAMFGSQSVPDRMNRFPLPNSSQMDGLPGSHSRPGIGMSGNPVYGTSQAYGGGGNYVYPSASLGGGILSGNGIYPGYRGGSMQNARPGLNNAASGIIGNGYNVNQPGPSQGFRDNSNSNPFLRPPTDLMPDIFNRPTNERMGEQFDYIMNDPRKTNDEIKTLLENIRPDADLPAEDREGTPDGLVYPLVSWL